MCWGGEGGAANEKCIKKGRRKLKKETEEASINKDVYKKHMQYLQNTYLTSF